MLRVLIIDDSPTEVYKLTTILEKNGYTVEVADTGEKGLQMAKMNPPDLILMDVVMPGLNGFQATRQLNRAPETAEVPVVIVSTKDQTTDKIWGMRQGASAYLVKPIVEADLLAAIAEATSS
ncbi:MAG: twitching motility two-component system response regulator PilH [Candidatus Endobugula sp.]|jgi:twitching motility two-component system response regulator PilH